MYCIILAGGYATRLYPLTKDTPKPLLKVAGKPIIEHILDKLNIDIVSTICIVTNNRFNEKFEKWLHGYDAKKPIEIINDGTSTNEDRLGALGDLNFVVNHKRIDDDVFVIAGDNLFELSLQDMITIFNKHRHNVVVLYDVKDKDLAKHYGVVELRDKIITSFEEKPENPQSTLVSTGIYLFPKKTVGLINKYIEQGNNPDKTGDFIEWLCKREKVYGYVTDEKWYDIGSFEQLERADNHYK